MSFNSIINNSFERFRIIFENALERANIDTNSVNELGRINNAQLDLLIKNIENIDGLLSNLNLPNEFSLFDVKHITSYEDFFTSVSERNLLIKNLVENKFINYKNRMSLIEDTLISQKNKVLQKLAFLNHAANNYQKVFIEEFNNSEFIDGSNTTLDIDKNSRIATLPISSSVVAKIEDIFLTEICNGISGSLDSSTNGNLWFTNDLNENTLFEYNKLDTGPCLLGIKYTFSELTINEIRIKTRLVNLTSSFKIKNIVFESSTFGSKTIKELCDLEKQNLNIDYFSYDKNIGYCIKFLPVKCSSITIEFEQTEYQNIYIQQTSQVSYRKVFTIAISEINFYSNTYNNEGILKSTIFELGNGLKGCDYKLEVYPKNNAYYESNMDLFEGNSSKSISLLENKFNLLIGNSSNFNYKLYCKKVSLESNKNQIDSNFETLIESKSISRYLDTNSNQITIDDVFLKESVFLCRPDIVKRSKNLEKSIIVNMEANSSQLINGIYKNKVKVPMEILSLEGIKFFKGSESNECTYQKNTSDSSITVNIGSNNFIGIQPLKVSLNSKKLIPILKIDTIYFEIKENFEPDKSKFKIYNLNNDQKTHTKTVNFDRSNLDANSIFDLDRKNITQIYSLTSGNVNYDSFTNELNLNSIEGKFSFSDNFIQLLNRNENSSLTISYKYKDSKDIKIDDFEFWFKENSIKGIAIKLNDLYVNTIEEALKDTTNNQKKFKLNANGSMIVNSLGFSKQIFNGENFEFVDYIDGFKEFNTEKESEDTIPDQEMDYDQPLIGFRINREIKYETSKLITTYNESKSTLKRQFTILVKDQICDGYIVATDALMNNIIMELNTDLSNDSVPYNKYSQAIYSLESNTGIFIGKRDDVILRKAKINYKYYLSSEDTNKVSVDYLNSTVYTSKPIDNASTVLVTYKVCDVSADYSICLKLESELIETNQYQYNSSIESTVAPLNKNIRLYYGKIKNNYDIKDTFQYYSPLIYSIKLGFN
jgi:hypothetical protein